MNYKCGHNNVLELPNIDTVQWLVFIRGLLLLVITNTFSLNINKTPVKGSYFFIYLLDTFFPSLLIHFTSLTFITTYNEKDTLLIFVIIIMAIAKARWF